MGSAKDETRFEPAKSVQMVDLVLVVCFTSKSCMDHSASSFRQKKNKVANEPSTKCGDSWPPERSHKMALLTSDFESRRTNFIRAGPESESADPPVQNMRWRRRWGLQACKAVTLEACKAVRL